MAPLAAPFSFQELAEAGGEGLAPLEYFSTSDGAGIAFRRYVPERPRVVLVFLHGGGAHSGLGYQFLGNGLKERHAAAVYTPDMRGHGASAGPRGDAPSVERLWQDCADFLKRIRQWHPGLPLVLGGHSAGAGLALNVSAWKRRPPVDGFAFLSPEFGFRSRTARAGRVEFAEVRLPAFVVNAMSGGLLWGHFPAVRFQLPSEILEAYPELVTAYSVHCANAVTPSAPQKQWAALTGKIGVWIGAEDELLNASAVARFAQTPPAREAQVQIVEGHKHLSILVEAASLIGPWLDELR
jgi:alpha-beta hydrolase superfamily lysophospholipase